MDNNPLRHGESHPLWMKRPYLDAIPDVPLPPHYRLRPLRGLADEAPWLELIRAAEQFASIDEDTFRRAYGTEDSRIAERVYFLEDETGLPIATIGAWFGTEQWAGWGRIHWLYIRPAYQGKGLGKGLLSFALRRLNELGDHRSYLKTATERTAAVRLYTTYGFVPCPGDFPD